MKFLVAGFGSIGRRHFRNLITLGEHDVIFYRTQKSTLPDDELNGFVVETDLRVALSHKPDAVIVANPTAMHLDVAIPATRSGCYIFMEKPLSNSMDRVFKLKKAFNEGGGKLLMGYQFRFHPSLIKAASLMSNGYIGRLLSVRAHWGEYLPGWHPWEDYRKSYSSREELGGGVILTLCHPLDYLRWMLGEIEKVWASTTSSSDLNIPVEDTAEIGLMFSNGVIGSIHLNYTQRPPSHRWEVVGTEGTLKWEDGIGNLEAYNISNGKWETFFVPDGFKRNDLFLAEMCHFLEVLLDEVVPISNLDDGIRILEIALAAIHSAKTNQVVKWD